MADSKGTARARDVRGASPRRGLGFVAISTVALVAVLGAATFGPRAASLGSRRAPAELLATPPVVPSDQEVEIDLGDAEPSPPEPADSVLERGPAPTDAATPRTSRVHRMDRHIRRARR